MDTIPDHVRDRITRANGAVDWITEEWIRSEIVPPEPGKHAPNTRGHALRDARKTLQGFLSARLAAVSNRF